MSSVTPRSNTRLSHTPKMSERKRALFQSERHSNLRNVDLAEAIQEDSSDSCDLGIISSLDSSSSPERYDQSVPRTPNTWRSEVRQGQRTIKPNPKYVKDFLKSPLNFWNYRTRNRCVLNSAPVTPQKSETSSPLSTEKYTIGTMSVGGGKSKARKSLMTLIADTESCSSSLKDLTFDSDSGAESKENTPNRKNLRSRLKSRSIKHDSLSNYGSGPDSDGGKYKTNISPLKTINSDSFSSPQCNRRCFIILDKMPSPSKILKTPHDCLTLAEDTMSPPMLHNRKGFLDVIDESPACDKDINNLKRVRDNTEDNRKCSPQAKQPKINPVNPKAKLSLFNDKIKQFLSAKSFYPKSSVDLNASFTTSVSHAIRVKYTTQNKRMYSMSAYNKKRKERKRVFGEINMGVRHKIRKPKLSKINKKSNPYIPFKRTQETLLKPKEVAGVNLCQDEEMTVNEAEIERPDPFETEHQTIESLLNQWTEEDIPSNEPRVTFTEERARHEIRIAESLVHNSSLSQTVLYMEPLPGPTATVAPLSPFEHSESSMDSQGFHQMVPTSGSSNKYLPVDGGFIVVDDALTDLSQEPKNLEEIEKEIKFLDDQISTMAKINNINADLLLSPTAQMCDMASDLALTSPKVINGLIVTGIEPLEEVPYGVPSVSKEITILCEDSGSSSDLFRPTTTKAFDDSERLFPVFTKDALRAAPTAVKAVRTDPITPKKISKKLKASHSGQYIIDAGQKKIGATQCNECGVIYHIGDPQDEMDHLMHHNAVDVLRFQGWKDEFVCGVWGTARSIRIRGSGSESGVNGIRWKRVLKLLDRVVHPQLGYVAQLPTDGAESYTAYLYIENRQIIGCLVAEIKTSGHKFLPGTVDCCSRESYPVKCGVSRLWTHISHRRRGVATHLLNSMRTNFLYGQILNIEDIAFSAPTPAGRVFAESYTDTENFLIYIN